MNRPITPAEMQDWIKHTWQKCQDEAWKGKGMTREDIIRMAREAGAYPAANTDRALLLMSESHLERFAALVAEQEREECAKVCDEKWPTLDEADIFAAAIRARGEK